VYALWAPAYVPLLDLPNHMARHYLEYRSLTGQQLPPGYTLQYQVLPNLGADLTLPLLLCIMPPVTACKLFLTLAVFLFWLGPALFVMQEAGSGRTALLAALLLLPLGLCNPLFCGFLNYYLGIGLAFLALAHYSHLSRKESAGLFPWVLHTVLVTAVFFSHLAAWGIYLLVMACLLLGRTGRRYGQTHRIGPCLRPVVVSALAVVPTLGLLAYYLAHQNAVDPHLGYRWRPWFGKAILPLTLLRCYEWQTDIASALLWLAAFGLMFRLGPWRLILRQGSVLAAVALFLAFLAAPLSLGTTDSVDSRLLPALVVCGVASAAVLPLRWPRLALLVLAAAALLRVGAVAHHWAEVSGRLEMHAHTLAPIQPRSRVLPVVVLTDGKTDDVKSYPEYHFIGWAVVSNDAFVPTLFDIPGQQPLRVAGPRVREVWRGPGPVEIDEATILGRFEYVWVCNPTGCQVRLPESCECVCIEGQVSLWRVRVRHCPGGKEVQTNPTCQREH
jgi:hypothetical protein